MPLRVISARLCVPNLDFRHLRHIDTRADREGSPLAGTALVLVVAGFGWGRCLAA